MSRTPFGIPPFGATLAQLVEHVTENHGVPSSILGGRTIPFGELRRGVPHARALFPRLGAVARLVVHVSSDVLYWSQTEELV